MQARKCTLSEKRTAVSEWGLGISAWSGQSRGRELGKSIATWSIALPIRAA